MREINKIFIHCSATPNHMDIGANEIRDWHVRGNGWSDIGYHYVIRQSGEVEKGREDSEVGAHVRGHNTNSIGICLVGDSNFTMAQWSALKQLIIELHFKYPQASFHGHNEYDSGKSCPNFDVQHYLKHLS